MRNTTLVHKKTFVRRGVIFPEKMKKKSADGWKESN